MNIILVTPPAVEPITAAEAFYKLKLTTDPEADVSEEPDYAEVMRCIKTAREDCEQITRRAFVTQTLKMVQGPAKEGDRRGLLWYMNGGTWDWGRIELKRPPLISVTSVKYYDESNVLQTVSPSNYFTTSGLVPRVQFVEGFDAPSVYLREDAIQVEYVAGYAPSTDSPPDLAANVPDKIKSAILLGVQMLFDKLTPAEHDNIEKARDSLLASFIVESY